MASQVPESWVLDRHTNKWAQRVMCLVHGICMVGSMSFVGCQGTVM